MNLPPGAYISEEGWIVYGDQAYLPEEWNRLLTDNDRRVLTLMAEGKAATVQEAADYFGLAKSTVRNQLMEARRRTGIRSTAELVALVAEGAL